MLNNRNPNNSNYNQDYNTHSEIIMTHVIIGASSRENLFLGFLTKWVSNQSPQLQRLGRKFKFQLKFMYDTFQKANNKGADQTALMRRLVCACVSRKPQKTGFLASRPIALPSLCDLMYFFCGSFMFLFCLVFAMFCARLFICALWSPAGKGLTSWLSFVVSSVSLSLSHWYPGSGVVLDCIDSWSLQPYCLV